MYSQHYIPLQLYAKSIRSPYMLAFMAEIYEEEAINGTKDSVQEAVCALSKCDGTCLT